jgi:hypothetical protein
MSRDPPLPATFAIGVQAQYGIRETVNQCKIMQNAKDSPGLEASFIFEQGKNA